MLQGWTAKTAQELDATIRTWAETLNHYRIPLEHYSTLYQRAFDFRQSRLASGGNVPEFDATLLVSQWTGINGLQRELMDAEIKSGRSLTAGCEHCHGKGFRLFGEGRYAGVTKCDHQPL